MTVELLLATCLQSIMADYECDNSLSESSDSIQSDIAYFNEDFERDYLDIFGNSDSSDGEDFEGFRFDIAAEDIKWTLGNQPYASADPDALTDLLQPGPTINLPAKANALFYFQLFFGDDILLRIIEWTEANAAKKGYENWRITLEELKAYLGIVLIMNGLLTTPRTERYFISDDRKWIFHTNINKVFKRDRFTEIERFLHLCDPNLIDGNHDRLRMIRPVLNHLQDRFKSLYVLSRDISVDESMIPFKGNLSWTQRMPQKPVKVGIKVFVVAESSTGYCWNFEIYTGKKSDHIDFGLGKTDMVVVDLLKDLTHRGHNLYVDNYYTSVPLFVYLQKQGILCCGTMRSNRKHFPHGLLGKDVKRMERGESRFASCKALIALVWKDSKPVYFLSTIHNSAPGLPVSRNIKKNGRYEKTMIQCPQLVQDYNEKMLGVDRCDQQSILKKDKKQKRFYVRIFLSIMMKAINNAYIMEGHVNPHTIQGKRRRDMLSFREELALQLIGNVRVSDNGRRGRKRRSNVEEEESRLKDVGIHLPQKGEGKDHRCIVCRKK